MSEATKFFVLLSFLVKFNESRLLIANCIVASYQNTATSTRQLFLIVQIHTLFLLLNLAPEIVKFGRKFYVIKKF